jgi:drug/metabolite transporter (DMT)-like permease
VLFKAYSLLPAQLAQPLNFVWPVMIVLLSIPLLKQKISFRSFAAIIISFAGVVIISTAGKISLVKFDNFRGIILALSSSLVWALFWIFNLRNKQDEQLKLCLNFAFGFFYILIFEIFTGKCILNNLNLRGFIGAVYIGFFEMGITFVIWLKALKYAVNTATINNLIYLTPFLSLLVIGTILKEQIRFSTLIGLLFIVSGIILQKRFAKI